MNIKEGRKRPSTSRAVNGRQKRLPLPLEVFDLCNLDLVMRRGVVSNGSMLCLRRLTGRLTDEAILYPRLRIDNPGS